MTEVAARASHAGLTVLVRRLADLAFHFANSHDSERGVRYLQRAEEEALRTYAPQQALAHLQTALALLEAMIRDGALSCWRLGKRR